MTGAYLVPEAVFVGDNAKLIFPLPRELENAGKKIIVDNLPSEDNIIITKIEFMPHTKEAVVDFIALEPGVITVSAFDVDGITIPELTFNIASILEKETFSSALSPAEKPLPANGTWAIITGSALSSIIALTVIFLFITRGPRYIRLLAERVRVFLVTAKVKRFISKVKNKQRYNKITPKEGITLLCEGIKNYLGELYKKNYNSFSAEDFLENNNENNLSAMIYKIIIYCDKYKFGKEAPSSEDMKRSASEMNLFVKSVYLETIGRKPKDGTGVSS